MEHQKQTGTNWLPWAGFLVMLGGAVYNGGQLTGRIDNNTERISKLEARQSSTDAALSGMNERTARIEVKIDLLIGDREKARE